MVHLPLSLSLSSDDWTTEPRSLAEVRRGETSEMCNNSIFMLFSASLLQLEIVQNDMETNAASDTERDQEKERYPIPLRTHPHSTLIHSLRFVFNTKNERKTF